MKILLFTCGIKYSLRKSKKVICVTLFVLIFCCKTSIQDSVQFNAKNMTKDSYVVFLQELAFSSFKKMASVLNSESHNNVGFMVVKDTVSSILSGISNVLQSSASLASVDATDSQENITGYTDNSTEGGVVSVKESVSNQICFHCLVLFISHLPFLWFLFSA